MGVIDSNAYVSEFTQKTLEQFDWVKGDPIPENMGDILADVHAKTAPSKKYGIYVDAELMTPEDIELVKAALRSAKTGKPENTAINAATAGIAMDESARQLFAKLQAPKTTDTDDGGLQVVDDRETAAPEPETAAQTTAEEIKSEIPDPLPEVPQVEPFCPRCNWDMRLKFESEVTQQDKEAFIAITLGGERFKKTYELLGGKYKVRFRSLMAEENSDIHHQLLIDQRNGDFLNDTEWFLRFFEYRLACSIESITINNKPAILVPELDEVAAKPLPNETEIGAAPTLARIRKYVLAGTLKNEITRRIVGNQFRQFQRLYETLEAMALEPNFWEGIE
jgi:hypothetical protein